MRYMNEREVILMKRLFVLAVLFALILSSCQVTETPPVPTPDFTISPTEPPVNNLLDPDLLGQVWYWRAFLSNDDNHHVVIKNPEAYTVQFMEDGFVTFQADCNNAGGEFIQQDSSLSFGMLEITAQYCGADSFDMDYMGYLHDVVTYIIEEDVLYLNLKMDAGDMVFTAAADTPLPLLANLQPDPFSLVGPVWYWQGLQSMDDIHHIIVPDPTNYSFQLNPDGSVQIQADCNTGFSTYTLADSSLVFEPIVTTKVGCPPDSLGTEFVSNLEYVMTYVFEDGLLYLNLAMDGGNLIFSTTPEPVTLPF
jgi:heat shock protein HslJ